jgi:hypothetical protein
MTLRHFVAPALLLGLLLSGCRPPSTFSDGGTDGGSDGGGDASVPVPDSGSDPVDAGEPVELKVTQVLPPRGGSAGGAQVLITGTGFINGFAQRGTEAVRLTQVKFGSNPSIDVQIIDDETIDARVPPGRAGLTNLTVVNPNGTFVCSGCFTYFDELSLSGLSPAAGPLSGGNTVTLNGTGFTDKMHVLFGGISSPQVTLVSSTELRVVAPRGRAADLVDVVVYNKNGLGQQRRGYRYHPAVRVTGINPLTGPQAGNTQVILTGTGFEGATAVRFGATAATSFTVDSPTQITATSPAGAAAGAVDLTVVTPRESWTVKSGFTYADPAGTAALFGLFPHVGAAAGGNTVTLTGQGLDAAGLTVTFGGQAATVLVQTATTATVTVPARGGSNRRVDVAVGGVGSLASAYVYRLELSAITPNHAPIDLETAVAVTGAHLPDDAEVRIGALLGARGATTEIRIDLTTPRGSGGAASDVWVREARDPENEAVLAGAFTFDELLAIGRVQPDRGAIAGGTLVTVFGAGFGEGTVVNFGPNRAKDIKILDSHTLTCRTPRGDLGSVTVQVERLGPKDDLAGGFSYYDPRSISGGLSGGPLTGTLNVTVLDSTQGSYGAPVPLAEVMLGTDASTPFQGRTDNRGQLTFSDPSLVKAQTVTVYKVGYASATVTAVNSENLTVFIARTGGGGGPPGAPPEGIAPGLISGRVTGFKAPKVLANDETLEARVFLAQQGLYSGAPFRGPPNRQGQRWVVNVDGGDYLLATFPGLSAAYAILGVLNATTQEFTPYLMGVRRGITTSSEQPAENQDIVLDMHLDMTVPVTVDTPVNIPVGGTSFVPAENSIYAWLDLGAEGFIPNPNNWKSGTGSATTATGVSNTLSLPNFPRLDGANFIFLNFARSTAFGGPISLYFRRQPGDLTKGITIGPMLPPPRFVQPSGSFNGTIAWQAEPGVQPDIHRVEILKRTFFGDVVLWSVVLPGTETQVVLPPTAVQKLREEEADTPLFIEIFSSRSPKFNYAQWTYETLSEISWSSFTASASNGFIP